MSTKLRTLLEVIAVLCFIVGILLGVEHFAICFLFYPICAILLGILFT